MDYDTRKYELLDPLEKEVKMHGRDEFRNAEWNQGLDDGYDVGFKEATAQLSAINGKVSVRDKGSVSAESWNVDTLHADCPQCEEATENAVVHAKATGSSTASYSISAVRTQSMTPDETTEILHWASVVRA